jgi:hypothetical protein
MKKLHGGASAAPAVLACLYVAPAMTLIAASWAATRIPSPGERLGAIEDAIAGINIASTRRTGSTSPFPSETAEAQLRRMSLERTNASHFDVLDHILDKGIVVDAWVRLSRRGVDLMTRGAHVVVASIETCLNHAEVGGARSVEAKSVDQCAAPIGRTHRRRVSGNRT